MMTKNWPLIVTIYTGICLLIDKYAAKIFAMDLYIKPEFELIWILILYLVLYATGETKKRNTWTGLALIVLSLVTAISVIKIVYSQV